MDQQPLRTAKCYVKLITEQKATNNILFVKIIDGEKIYTVRQDDVNSDDYDSAVELGYFDLCGETYNARFADIY